jgi:hypothetical protein
VFDLEQRIQQWRYTLAQALTGRPEVIAELESHLREEVHRLLQAGQTPELAWEEALRRLGGPEQLAAEFGKLPPAGSAFWLPARLVLIAQIILSVCLAGGVLLTLKQGKTRPLLAAHVFAVTAGYTTTFAVGLLAVWSIFTRAVHGWDARRTEAVRATAWKLTLAGLVLTGVGVGLGCWWARDNLGRYWGWDPKEVGALGVLAWYGLMVWCLQWRPRSERAGMLMGVVGNVVVSLSWFGAALVADVHSYGIPPYLPVCLAGFVISQLLIFGVAFVPPGRLARRRAE